jgi:hypothetical protein
MIGSSRGRSHSKGASLEVTLDTGPHGYNRYTDGCRCEVCREAKAGYMRRRRAAGRLAAQLHAVCERRPGRYVAPIKRHGTRYGYEEMGCRCDLCSAARAESDRRTYLAAITKRRVP